MVLGGTPLTRHPGLPLSPNGTLDLPLVDGSGGGNLELVQPQVDHGSSITSSAGRIGPSRGAEDSHAPFDRRREVAVTEE